MHASSGDHIIEVDLPVEELPFRFELRGDPAVLESLDGLPVSANIHNPAGPAELMGGAAQDDIDPLMTLR